MVEEITTKSTKAIVRDSNGKFVKGNKEGRKFPKGYAGKPKGEGIKRPLQHGNLPRMSCTLTRKRVSR